MAILIGGSPSTGSSLLRRVLNRHSLVFCGSETSLFAKEELYTDWTNNRKRLFKRFLSGLRNAGWHHLSGVLIDAEYGLSLNEMDNILKSSPSFKIFIERFYTEVLKTADKQIWAEKTPSNVFCFDHFLKTFPGSKVIHIVRNPEDTIASLVNRGMHVYDACVIYLLNTSAGMTLLENSRCYTIKYEDFVNQPVTVISALCDFLDIPFEGQMLEADQDIRPNDFMKGWEYRETASIQSGSVGRFQNLDDRTKSDIISLMHVLKSHTPTNLESIPQLAEQLSYQIHSKKANNQYSFDLKKYISKDRFKRTIKRSYFNHFNYPVYVGSE